MWFGLYNLLSAARPKTGTTDILIWSMVLMGLLLVGLFVVVRLKKKLTQAELPGASGGFTLSDLRQLHKSGKMSDEEFEKAKARIVMAAKAATARGEASTTGQRIEPSPKAATPPEP